MKTKTVICRAALVLVTAGVVLPALASAAVVIYTDEAAWRAAVGLSVTEPFNATGLQPFTVVDTTSGGIGPARGVLSGSVWQDDVYYNPYYFSRTGFSYRPGKLMGAAALWDTSPNGDGLGVRIDLNWGYEMVYYSLITHGGFVGWTSSEPFDSFMLSANFRQYGGGETFDLDNLQFAPVPEPGSCGLLALGAAGLALVRRRRAAQPQGAKAPVTTC